MRNLRSLLITLSVLTALGTSDVFADSTEDVEVSQDTAPENEAYSDDYLKLIDHEAQTAMAEGNMIEARRLFGRLVELNPNDARALREFGRTSAAVGKLRSAVDALGKCNELREGAPDPELHFIRGESLMALNEESEGLAELTKAEEELQLAPMTDQTRLWQARIHALRKEIDQAEAIYVALRGTDPYSQSFKEVSLLLAEAYVMASKLDEAKDLLVAYSELHDSPRARELLAWVLELRGDTGAETRVRARLSDRWDGAQAPAMVGYARSLERSENYQEALSSYKSANDRGNVQVRKDIARIENRISPEVMALGEVRNDPTGTTSSIAAGGVMYVAERVRLSAVGAHDFVSKTDETLERGTLSAMFGFGHFNEVGVSAVGWRNPEGESHAGAAAVLHSNPARTFRTYVMAAYNEPWTESTATLRHGASASTLELQLYANVFTPRLVATSSLRARDLNLPQMSFQQQRSATEVFGSLGLDWIAMIGANRLRGHSMDNSLLRAASHNQVLVVSYRHNEVTTDGTLGTRIGLVQRSTVDEVSATARTIVDPYGVLGLGATGGLGYDSQRKARLWRAGGEVLVSISDAAHFSLSSELARESTTLFTGRRFVTQIGLHADF